MDTGVVTGLLEKKARELSSPLPLEFKFPDKEPRHPLEEKTRRGWETLKCQKNIWKKNDKNWFYATISFPTGIGSAAIGCMSPSCARQSRGFPSS